MSRPPDLATPSLPGLRSAGVVAVAVPARMLAELAHVGADGSVARVLACIPASGRELTYRFFLQFYAQGRKRIVPAFESLAAQAIKRGWPLPVGGITLAGWARGSFKGLAINNDLAAFYVVALRIKRPEFAAHLELTAPLPSRLLTLDWSPFARGKEPHRE